MKLVPGIEADSVRMPPVDLVPRFRAQGYAAADVARRRLWVEHKTGVRLEHVGACSVPTEQMRGNIENPIGSVQVPVGIAGPLLIRGDHARGSFYVPLATTEGALVRSYERGMVTLTRAGGVTTHIETDENRVCPIFMFDSVADAGRFVDELPEHCRCFGARRSRRPAMAVCCASSRARSDAKSSWRSATTPVMRKA